MFRYDAAWVVEFIQPCLVRFIYLSPANRVYSCLNVLTITKTCSGGFRTKSRRSWNCVFVWRENVREEGRERTTGKWGEEAGEKERAEGAEGEMSGNVIPISIEAPLWSYERERSQTVLLSSLSLVLRLNYLWTTSIEGMWWVKGSFSTNNTKSRKKGPQMEKKKKVTSTSYRVKGCEPGCKEPVQGRWCSEHQEQWEHFC